MQTPSNNGQTPLASDLIYLDLEKEKLERIWEKEKNIVEGNNGKVKQKKYLVGK